MTTLNRLHRLKDLLLSKYGEEIRETGDWFWKSYGWEINFYEDDTTSSVTAYRVKDGVTDWSDYATLEKYVREWRKVL
jgi:hypothetical protein